MNGPTPNKSLFQEWKIIWGLLAPKERRDGFWLLLLSFLNVGLDLLSLAAIFPVVLMVLEPNFWQSVDLPDNLKTWLLQWPIRTLQLGVILATMVLFLVKNGISVLIAHKNVGYFRSMIIRLVSQSYNKMIRGTTLQSFLQKHGGEDLQQLIFIPSSFANNVVRGAFQMLTEGLMMIILVGILVVYNPMAFVTAVIALSPGIGLLIWLRRRTSKKIGQNLKSLYNEYLSGIQESVAGYMDISLSGQIDTFQRLLYEKVAQFHRTHQRIQAMNMTTPRLVETTAVMGILSILTYLVAVEADTLSSTLTLGIYLAGSYRLIPSLNTILQALTFYTAHRYTIFEVRALIPAEETSSPLSLSFNHRIQLDHIAFQYGKETFSLEDITLEIQKGEKIALVGQSGSGKTTLIHLILGLFRPSAGRLVVDDTPLQEGHLDHWHTLVSYVPQNPMMLDGSIMENIAFGVPADQIDHEKLRQVVKLVELSDMIDQLPEGWNTPVGKDALRISAGQRQRLALARALYQDRPFMILDEVTANLDAKTEASILDTLVNLSHSDRTIMFITHRPKILDHCDAIWDLKDGRLQQIDRAQVTMTE